MTTLTTAVPCLTEAELDAVSGGRAPSDYLDGWMPRVPQMNPLQYAYAYCDREAFRRVDVRRRRR